MKDNSINYRQKGDKVTVITGNESCFKPDTWIKIQSAMELHQNNHVQVKCAPKVYQRYTVIDQQLVWYGGINYLGFEKVAQGAMRLSSMELSVDIDTIQSQRFYCEKYDVSGH